MLASLLPLLLDGRVILGLGGLAAIIYAYFKGRRAGKKGVEDELTENKQRLLERLFETVTENKELERKVRGEISDSHNATDAELLDKFMQLKSTGHPNRPKDS